MVNLWSTTEHALGYLARADTIPHRERVTFAMSINTHRLKYHNR